MLYKQLVNGHNIPQLGLGTFLAKDETELTQALEHALKIGYRHLDCAAIYGNEKVVGNVIANSHVPREGLFITSKVWVDDFGYESTIAACKKTMQDLQVDYLDLYLLHWPDEHIGDTWRAMETLYNEGMVRAIGVSNFNEHHIEELAKIAQIMPMVNQVEAHPYFPQLELKKFCEDNNILFEAWGPFSQGKSDLLTNAVLVDLAKKYEKTVAQIVLRWHLQMGNIVFPKSINPTRLEENFKVFDFELTLDDMASIASINIETRFGSDPEARAYSI